MSKKEVIILGSTGSVGVNTLDVIRHYNDKFKVVGLSANRNIKLLKEQVEEFKPKFIAIADKKKAQEAKIKINSVKILTGEEGIIELMKQGVGEVVVVAHGGSSALAPTIEAIKNKKNICIANKEIIVMCGSIITELAKKYNINIIPLDSELSAIFQCLEGRNKEEIKKIILTGTGGPFHKNGRQLNLNNISIEEVLKHPRWQMGKKITVDSATLMNKGFEVIEAHHFFGVPPNKIEVVIHPEAIIHSMVEFIDGVIIAQLSITDMRIPIAYGLHYPKRIDSYLPSLDLIKVGKLTFEPPNVEKFPCLQYAYEAIKIGGTMPCVLNAADEVAVDKFLKCQISFSQISKIIKATLNQHKVKIAPTLEDILQVDSWARKIATEEALNLKNDYKKN